MTNKSKSTNRNLNNKTNVMVPPTLGKLGAKKIVLLLLTVVVFGAMVKLGFWQLDRGQQKQQIEQQLQQWQQAQPVDIATALSQSQDITGKKIAVTVSPIMNGSISVSTVYWDNQTWQGKVGYLVFQPVQMLDSRLETASTIALLELGFVAVGAEREQLPQVASVVQEQRIEGRLYRRQDNPMSEGLMLEEMPSSSAIRIQNLALESLAQHWQRAMLPYVIQPLSDLKLNDNKGGQVSEQLPHPWTPVPLSAQRHYGYAVQWFSMALVLLMLVVRFVFRSYRARNHDALKPMP